MDNDLKKIIDKIFNINDEIAFEHIYHYTDQSGLNGIIGNNNFHFSEIHKLNDSSEYLYTISVFEEALEILLKENPANTNLKDFYEKYKYDKSFILPKEQNITSKFFYHKFYVASFSLDKDSLLMWRYYTKDQKSRGYNLEFSKHLFNPNLDTNGKYNEWIYEGEVSYDKDLLIKKIEILILFYTKLNYTEESSVNNTLELYDILQYISLFNKHKGFENEHEYRVVVERIFEITDNKNLDFYEKFTEKDLTPYIEKEFDKSELFSICCSPTIEDENLSNNIKSYLNSNNIVINKSEIPLRF